MPLKAEEKICAVVRPARQLRQLWEARAEVAEVAPLLLRELRRAVVVSILWRSAR